MKVVESVKAKKTKRHRELDYVVHQLYMLEIASCCGFGQAYVVLLLESFGGFWFLIILLWWLLLCWFNLCDLLLKL